MQVKLELASGWKSLCGILGITFLYLSARIIYASIGLSVFFFSNEITLFRTLGILFFLLFLLVLFVLSGLMAYFFLYKFKKEQLIISEGGIEHESFGYRLHSKWVNTKYIKSIGTLGHINGINVLPDNLFPWLKLPIRWLANITSQGEYFIPLSMFDINWRDSELGQQIKQYAPHLFDKEKSA